MTYQDIGLTYREKVSLRKKKDSTLFWWFWGIVFLCGIGYASSLALDLFVFRQPAYAQEYVILEDYEGQTIELCKEKLSELKK